jgi:hypothetical protein
MYMYARTISVVFVGIKSVAATNYYVQTAYIHCIFLHTKYLTKYLKDQTFAKICVILGRTLIRPEGF